MEGTLMDVLRIIALSELGAGVLIARTWHGLLRRRSSSADWRNRASFLALVLASIALAVQFVLVVLACFHSLEELDSSSLRGGWSLFVAHLWLWSFFATGLLALCGVVLAMLGKGSLRIAAGVWSSVVLGMFLVNLVLFVNSFH